MSKRNLLPISFALIVLLFLFAAKPVKAQVDFTWTGNCVNNPTLFTPIVNAGSIASSQWDFGDGYTSAAQNTMHQYNATGTYIVTLTVIDTSSVTSSVSHSVTIVPLPLAHFEVPANKCEDTPVPFNDLSSTSTGYIVRWTWQFGDGTMLVVNHPSNPDVYHTYAVSGTYNATLTVKTSDSCENTETQVIEIDFAPLAFFAFSTPNCINNIPVQFTDLSSVYSGYVLNWIWDFGDGSQNDTIVFPNNPDVTHQFPAPGTYNVTLTVINSVSCSNSISVPVTVYPAPVANFLYNSPVFEDQNVQFTDASSPNGSLMIVAWSWNFGDPASGQNNTSNLASPQHLYANPGTYTVSQLVTNTNGCVDTIMQTLVINATTSIDFTWIGQCVNSPTQFTPVLNGATITQYNWDFGDGNTSTGSNPAHTYSNYGAYTVTLTVTDNNGAISTVAHTVMINPSPLANFTSIQNCLGLPVLFSDLSQAGSGSIVQWNWNFGDPASGVSNTSLIQNPQHQYTAAGTYQVILSVTSSLGCTDTIVKTVVVHALPPVDFNVSDNCVNALVSFTPNASVMNIGAIAGWLWDFGDGTTSSLESPIHVYLTAGTYNVTLSVTDTISCSNSASKVLSIHALPVASFNYTFPACTQSTISFTDLSQTNGNSAIVSWLWNFGDTASGAANTSTLQNPVHVFSIPGTYLVTLTVSNNTGCSSSITLSVDVHQTPTADFSFTTPVLNEPVFFSDLSLPASGTIVAWSWDFGDGNTSALQNPVHVYSLPGTYTVGLNITNVSGCGSYADSLLVVEPGAGSVTLTGRVIAGNDTLNNAAVHLIQLDGAGQPVSLLTTTPGTNNEFVFDNIPEGNYYLHATPQYNGPLASAYLPTFYLNSLYWQSATLITLGQPQNPYHIHLVSYQIINGGTFIINGQIVNAGKSVNPADQEVLLLDNQSNPIRWTITDASGYFSFDSLPAGSYAVNPVITGITTFPYYVTLNTGNSPAFVKMVISGQVITDLKPITTANQFFEIFPNPAVESITVKLNNPVSWFSTEIFSIKGERLLSEIHTSENSCNLNISMLAKGLYLLKITDNKGISFTEKVMKE